MIRDTIKQNHRSKALAKLIERKHLSISPHPTHTVYKIKSKQKGLYYICHICNLMLYCTYKEEMATRTVTSYAFAMIFEKLKD